MSESTARPPRTVRAVLHGGPAGGRVIDVPVTAGYPPVTIGEGGGNYYRPRGLVGDDVEGGLTYRWWQLDQDAPDA